MAKKSKNKPTKNQVAFKKEVKRIKRAITRESKRGLELKAPLDLTMPKRVTQKRVDDLKKLTPDRLRAKMIAVDPKTLEIISGTERMAQIRSDRAKKAAETRKQKKEEAAKVAKKPKAGDVNGSAPQGSDPVGPKIKDNILTWIYDMLAGWQAKDSWRVYSSKAKTKNFADIKEDDKNTLRAMLDGLVQRLGEDLVAKNAEKNAEEIKNLVESIIYGQSGDRLDKGVMYDMASVYRLLSNEIMDEEKAKSLQDSLEWLDYEEEN